MILSYVPVENSSIEGEHKVRKVQFVRISRA